MLGQLGAVPQGSTCGTGGHGGPLGLGLRAERPGHACMLGKASHVLVLVLVQLYTAPAVLVPAVCYAPAVLVLTGVQQCQLI